MPAPDFAKMTTDDLLQILPASENTEWEFKASAVFGPSQFGEFKKQKLGKIVSSFANSGGGYLLLGKQDGVAVFETVPIHEGRATMEDHLSLVISQCVTPHYRNFSIHRVPISAKANESVLVVEFSDSPAAPHQSVADVNYYYRLPGHVAPAPHFHLDLLRNRFTKAVLKVENPAFAVELPHFESLQDQGLILEVTTTVDLTNTSTQIAEPCGLRVFADASNDQWLVNNEPLSPGLLLQPKPSILFPSLSVTLEFVLSLSAGGAFDTSRDKLISEWKELTFLCQALSQNFVGESVPIQPYDLLGDSAEKMLEEAIAKWNGAVIAANRKRDRLQIAIALGHPSVPPAGLP